MALAGKMFQKWPNGIYSITDLAGPELARACEHVKNLRAKVGIEDVWLDSSPEA